MDVGEHRAAPPAPATRARGSRRPPGDLRPAPSARLDRDDRRARRERASRARRRRLPDGRQVACGQGTRRRARRRGRGRERRRVRAGELQGSLPAHLPAPPRPGRSRACGRGGGARSGLVIFTTRAHSDVEAALRAAIRERRRRDDSDRFIDVQVGPNRYVAGRGDCVDRACLRRISPSRKSFLRVRFRVASTGCPTLVQNVETLAHAALIARFGAWWFGRSARSGPPGPRCSRSAARCGRRACSRRRATPRLPRSLTAPAASTGEPAAVLLGGYFGRWVPSSGSGIRPSTPIRCDRSAPHLEPASSSSLLRRHAASPRPIAC